MGAHRWGVRSYVGRNRVRVEGGLGANKQTEGKEWQTVPAWGEKGAERGKEGLQYGNLFW